MTLTFPGKGFLIAVATAFAVIALAVTALATAAPSRAECGGEAVGAENCVADCPENQVRDDKSGQCATKANESAEAQLKSAWEQAFGPVPSGYALPSTGLPGIGVDPVSIAQAASAWAAAASTLPPMALPSPPPMPCVGFATPIPFVGFSTC
jgi:hypothetical protein